MGRIGAIITPFIATVLFEESPHIAVSFYGSLGILTGILALIVQDTKGKDLKVKINFQNI